MKKYKYFYISKIYYIFFIKQFFIKFEISNGDWGLVIGDW